MESIMDDFLDEALKRLFIQPRDFPGLGTGMLKRNNHSTPSAPSEASGACPQVVFMCATAPRSSSDMLSP